MMALLANRRKAAITWIIIILVELLYYGFYRPCLINSRKRFTFNFLIKLLYFMYRQLQSMEYLFWLNYQLLNIDLINEYWKYFEYKFFVKGSYSVYMKIAIYETVHLDWIIPYESYWLRRYLVSFITSNNV